MRGVCMVCSIYVACSTYWQQPWQLIIAARSPFPGTQTTALQWADTTRAGKANDGHWKKAKTQSLVKIKRANDRVEKKVATGKRKKHNIFVRQRQYWHEKLKEAKEVLV